MSESKSALIFGASGFVGGYLARELKTHGYEVFGSDRSVCSQNAALDEYRPCDITDAEKVSRVVGELRPSAVVNLAAVSSVGQSWRMPQMTMQVNVIGALNVMEAALSMSSMPRVLLVGSSEEYAPSDRPLKETDPVDATNPYGISKVTQERFAELYAERHGLKVYLARSFNHTGVGQSSDFVLPSWCKQAADIKRSGKPGTIQVGNLGVSRDFSDVRDIVCGYRLLLESEYSGEPFNFGSGSSVSLREILMKITSLADVEIFVETATHLLRPNDTPYIQGDTSKAADKLGWHCEYSLMQTLNDMFQACLDNGSMYEQ